MLTPAQLTKAQYSPPCNSNQARQRQLLHSWQANQTRSSGQLTSQSTDQEVRPRLPLQQPPVRLPLPSLLRPLPTQPPRPRQLHRMCKPKPTDMGGDNVIGVSSHVSLIDHLDVGASVAVTVILLLILGCMCAFRQGWCLKAILGRRWAHLHLQNQTLATTTPPQQAPTSTVISMTPASATTNNHMIETLDEELLILQKKNAIIELQNKRASLMELTPMAYNPSYNPKYPVM